MSFNNQYTIPSIDPNGVIAQNNKIGISFLYGIGIGAAITRSRIQASNEESYYVNNQFVEFDPDAKPNDAGGYDKTDRWDGYMSSSLIGMPVMCYLKFIGGDYMDLQGNTITIPDVTFETVVLTLTMGKNIQKTEITGKDSGSIKEYIGMKDWAIEIRAIVSADAPVNQSINKRFQEGVYPRENVAAIWKVLKAPIAIEVECWFLQQFGINYLVIEDGVQVDQIEGEYNCQRFVIPCVSDNPLVLEFAE